MAIPDGAPLIVYTGSLGPQYVPERMLDLLVALQATRLEHAFRCLHLSRARARIGATGPRRSGRALLGETRGAGSEIPEALAKPRTWSLALRQVSFSQRAICPIKVAEYLQCGVPVVTSPVGDLAEQLDPRVAFLLDPALATDLRPACEWFFERVLPARETVRQECREVGARLFGVEGRAGGLPRGVRSSCNGRPFGCRRMKLSLHRD